MNKSESKKTVLMAVLSGVGMAVSQSALSSGCSVPNSGKCTACGGCILVLAGLAGWAVWRRNQGQGTGNDV